MSPIWPGHFPEDCPCPDSKDAQGVIYRIVRTIPPSEIDFEPSPVEPPEIFGDPECIKCGISVYGKLCHVEKAKSRYRHFRNRRIIKIELLSFMGKIKPTPMHFPSHITWWIPVNFDPCAYYEIVK